MIKTYTINVPNEQYINDFSLGLTKTYEVDVPSELYLYFDHNGNICEHSEVQIESINHEVKILADTESLAEQGFLIWYALGRETRELLFENETNYDGSIYKKCTNLLPNDYYNINYNHETNAIQGIPFEEDTNLPNEKIVKTIKEHLEVKLSVSTPEEEIIINNFITTLDEYLNTVADQYPWKFIEFPDDLPEIPNEIEELLK